MKQCMKTTFFEKWEQFHFASFHMFFGQNQRVLDKKYELVGKCRGPDCNFVSILSLKLTMTHLLLTFLLLI